MNSPEDQAWQALLLSSRPTFTGDTAPPFGFVTAALSHLKAEKSRQREDELIGWRALFASLAALVAVAGLTVVVQMHHSGDLEPGEQSLVEVENIPLS